MRAALDDQRAATVAGDVPAATAAHRRFHFALPHRRATAPGDLARAETISPTTTASSPPPTPASPAWAAPAGRALHGGPEAKPVG
ncbi:hypothetical protein AB0M41_20080 [Streptomyces sp. NPDC051896]|uniref:hypothetical protein n=1 Tax=Streptomyces sp. NPDC051896 TaxID=3155416 RepID=UPI00341C610F